MSIADKLKIIAENQPKVYEAGKEERDLKWWTNYQSPESTDFGSYMFAGKAWNKETFLPKFTVGNKRMCEGIFYQHNQTYPVYDLVEQLKKTGVTMDFSSAVNLTNAFNSARISHLGVIDVSAVSSQYNSNGLFSSSYIETIDEVVFAEKTFDWHNNMFNGATALVNLTAKGVLANTINFQWCPLSPASMKSIISVLKDFTGTGNEYSKTIFFNDDCWAALEEDSTAPDGGTWADYVDSLGWNT